MGTVVVELIGEMRRASGTRLREAAEHLNVSEATVSRYERGHITPPDGALATLERYYADRLARAHRRFIENRAAHRAVASVEVE